MEIRELTCISCPLGCSLRVEVDENGKAVSVSGNTCKRGELYGKKEVSDPVRTVTSTVQVTGGKEPVVCVRTRTEIPKDRIFSCMEEIRSASIAAPVRIGDVVISGVAGTDVDVIVTKAVEREED